MNKVNFFRPISRPPFARRLDLFLIVACLATIHPNATADPRTAGRTTPGSAIPPEGGLLRLSAADNLAADEDTLRCVVSNPSTGYAWFGAMTAPGQVIKVALVGTNSSPSRVASVILEPGEDSLSTGVIDTNAGYAWFGTFTSPGRVIKVALGTSNSPPIRVGAVTLDAGEDQLFASVIDAAAGYAYFGTRTSPGRVVKIQLGTGTNPPTRVSGIPLAAEEGLLRSAVIDPDAGYAWFGTFTDPGRVVKVALGPGDSPPLRVDAVTLAAGENRLVSAVIDRPAGIAWFGTYTSPGKVVKVALGTGNTAPSRIDALTLNSGEGFLACGATSLAAPGIALFGCDSTPSAVVKVALPPGAAPPTRVGAVSLPAGEETLVSAADVGGSLFFGANTQPGRVIQIGPGPGGQSPVRQSAVALARGENDLQSVVIDAAQGYGWFGTATFPGQIVKVKLGKAGQPPQRIASLTLEQDENRPICAVADLAAGFAWFGTDSATGRVVKIALGNGDSPPVRIGAVTLNSDERSLRSAVIDLTNRFAYFGTAVVAPGKVVKVALGTGNNPPTRVGAVTLQANEWDFQSAVINAAGTHALFGTGQYLAETGAGGKVVKVALGTGNNPPTRVGVLSLPAGEDTLNCAVTDPLSGYAWFGATSGFTQAMAIKVAFETANAAPRRVGRANLSTNATPLHSAVIDVSAGYALFGGNRHVVKVALGSGEALPVRVGEIELRSNETALHCAAGDPTNGLAWFGTSTQPGNVVLASYSQKGFIKGSRIALAESAVLTNVYFYSHRAAGKVRLGLYVHSGINRILVWQSGEITNTITGGWIEFPIQRGNPTSLQLIAGTYDLAWQVDTTADVPSYLAGAVGDGFRVPADFGAFPTLLSENGPHWATTSEAWASYISYGPVVPIFTGIQVVNDTVTLNWMSDPGTFYQVQRSAILPPAWINVGPPVQATGLTTEWSEMGVIGTTSRVYRLCVP